MMQTLRQRHSEGCASMRSVQLLAAFLLGFLLVITFDENIVMLQFQVPESESSNVKCDCDNPNTSELKPNQVEKQVLPELPELVKPN
jgi:hypothetical protein